MARFFQEHAKGIAHNIVANTVVAAGAGLISWYTTNQAIMGGVPRYGAVLIGVGVFVLLAFAFAAIAWGVAKLRTKDQSEGVPMADPVSESLSTESPERKIVEIAPEELSGLYKVHTKEQADKLLSPYLGAWIFVSGVTVKHYMYGQEVDETTVVLKTGDVQVYARFPEWRQASRVLLAGNGVPVKVLGRIHEIQEGLVNLAECEVVEMKLPPPK